MHGLSTLNRLLGKKNKEASRSTSNLSKSTSNLDTSSQHNKISPIVNNAPFEQTFRVTVYLPKNQLYVERIGAKTKLATLLERISENKHLTPDKYEFRHPGDNSQVFDTEKTIGEVGLNELKLVLKTESRFNSDFHRFHPDDMLKYKTDSVSSSEISRNYSKNTMQKTSPYSSTTSLNSLDSTGMNLTAKTQPPVAPARKKRAAPRPPSQNSIPEQEIFGTTLNVFKEPHSILPRKNFHVSSPQLFNAKSDKNNNVETETRLNAITRPTSLFVGSSLELDNGRQRSPSESSEVQHILHERQNSNSLEKKKKPAPVPPKRVNKPVPSPRTVQDDLKITDIKEIDEQEVAVNRTDEKLVHDHNNVSKTMLNGVPHSEDHPSIETSTSDGPISIQIISSDNSIEPVSEESAKLPTVSKVHIKLDDERRSSSEDEMTVNIYNVTKSVVTLEKQNHMEKVENEDKKEEVQEKVIFEKVKKRQVSPEVEEAPRKPIEISKKEFIVPMSVEGREEAVKKPEVQEVQKVVEIPVRIAEKEKTAVDHQIPVETQQKQVESRKESFEIKQNSFETQKKSFEIHHKPVEIEEKFVDPPHKPQRSFPEPIAVPTSTATFTETRINVVETVNIERPSKVVESHSEVTVTEIPIEKVERKIEEDQRPTSPLWTYTLPAPPVFADSTVVDAAPTERKNGFSDFASTDCNETVLSDSNTTVISAETHIQPIIVHRKSLDDSFNIASPDPDDDSEKSTEIITSDLEDGYLGNGKNLVKMPEAPFKKEIVIEDFKRSRLLITRSDSFHSIGQARHFDVGAKRGPLSPQRSTSFLSLVQAQKAERIADRSDSAPYSRQKSNSELSISDTPSLQSLEVIKNILNSSRKNSLDVVESPPAAVKKPEEIVVKRQVSEPVVEAKPAETQWRYSGPPKINLGTWSERPKVEVAIASDSDYKFGKIAPRDFKSDASVTSKRHTIHISNDRVEAPEKHLPKVLGVEYKKDASPAAEIVNRPTRTIINIKPRPMSMDVGNSYSTVTTSSGYSRNVTSPTAVSYSRNVASPTSPVAVAFNRAETSSPPATAPTAVSYNRLNLNTNVKKFAPVVRGFKLNDIKEGSDKPETTPLPVVEKKASAPPSVPAKPAFIRSTSAGDINRNARFSLVETKVEETSGDLPFSQTTLRKTGLKDKILLSDKDTKSIFGRVLDTHEQKPARVHETNREEQVEKVAIRQMSMPPPPKPPTAPPPMNFRKSAPVDTDTRNELLDAIKNFNRDALRPK